ncbi:hypothetical protein E4U53_004069, partial [Claviceps sorghi]
MMKKLALGLLCLQGVPAARPAAARVVVESLGQVPRGWTALGPAAANNTIRLSIALDAAGGDAALDRALRQ